MKWTIASFRIETDDENALTVSFFQLSAMVSVHDSWCKTLLEVDNFDHRYKPCLTHAIELVKIALNKPTKSNFAKRRTKAMKPRLKVKK